LSKICFQNPSREANLRNASKNSNGKRSKNQTNYQGNNVNYQGNNNNGNRNNSSNYRTNNGNVNQNSGRNFNFQSNRNVNNQNANKANVNANEQKNGNVNTIRNIPSSDYFFEGSLFNIKKIEKDNKDEDPIMYNVKVNGKMMSMELDTAASPSAIGYEDYKNKLSDCEFIEVPSTFLAYDGSALNFQGYINVDVENKNGEIETLKL